MNKDAEQLKVSLQKAIKKAQLEELDNLCAGMPYDLGELFEHDDNPILHQAACHDDSAFAKDATEALLRRGVSPYLVDKHGRTALIHMARYRKYRNPVATLLRGSRDVPGDAGRTALMWLSEGAGLFSSRKGNAGNIRHLLSMGADPFITDTSGLTALGYAIRSNDKGTNEAVVGILKAAMIEHAAKAEFRSKYIVQFDEHGIMNTQPRL